MSDIEKASDRSSRNERRRMEKELADLTKKLTESQNQVTRFKTALDEADPDERKAIEAKADEESLSEDLKPADLAMRRLLTAASELSPSQNSMAQQEFQWKIFSTKSGKFLVTRTGTQLRPSNSRFYICTTTLCECIAQLKLKFSL